MRGALFWRRQPFGGAAYGGLPEDGEVTLPVGLESNPVVGAHRLLATSAADPGKRRTLAGYAVVDVNVRRRNLFKSIDAFMILENAFDRRYRAINIGAYSNAEELIGSPQNPRRISIGFDLRLK